MKNRKHVSFFNVSVFSVKNVQTKDDLGPVYAPHVESTGELIFTNRLEAMKWAEENILKLIKDKIDSGNMESPVPGFKFDRYSGCIKHSKDFDETDFERNFPICVGGTVTNSLGKRIWHTVMLVRPSRNRMRLFKALQNDKIPLICFWREGIAVR